MKSKIPKRGPQSTERDRPLDPAYKFIISGDFHRTFKLKERLQILLGYNLKLHFKAACLHNPGHWQPHLEAKTTHQLQPAKAP